MTTQLTVAVCTYNGSRQILATLQALQAQRIDVPFDILVVDDGSSDDTARLVEDAGFTVLRHGTNRGIGAARQTALEAATGDYVAFTDDDCLPALDWLAQLWALRDRHPEGGAWGGLTVPRDTSTLLNRYTVANSSWAPLPMDLAVSASPAYRLWRYAKSQLVLPKIDEGEVFSLAGSNMLLDRAAALAVGGFDPKIAFGGEEEDLLKRLREGGRPLWFTPAAEVLHEPVGSLSEVAHRAYLYGRGDARMFAEGVSSSPTIFPLPLAALTALALPRHWRWLAAAAPLAGYPRWVLGAAQRRTPEYVLYAYVQFLQEAASDLGWVGYAAQRLESHLPGGGKRASRSVRTLRKS